MLSEDIEKTDINEEKLNQMKIRIIAAERDNLKANKYTTQEMIKILRSIIEELADTGR